MSELRVAGLAGTLARAVNDELTIVESALELAINEMAVDDPNLGVLGLAFLAASRCKRSAETALHFLDCAGYQKLPNGTVDAYVAGQQGK